MTSVCKSKCSTFQTERRMFVDNVKFCSVCNIFYKCDDLRCLCCNYKMRTGPKYNLADKERLLAMRRVGGEWQYKQRTYKINQ